MVPSPAFRVSQCVQLNGSVGRQQYLLTGLGLSLLKYAVEASVISGMTGRFYTPLDYLTPLLSSRARFTEGAPEWLGMSLVLWTIPFVWIAVAMSIRRCRDAGISPWFGLIMLVPLVNFLGMFLLSLIPTKTSGAQPDDEQAQMLREVWKAPDPSVLVTVPETGVFTGSGVLATVYGLGAGILYALGSTVLTIYVLDSYGAALFFGTPLVSGAVSSFFFNRPSRRPVLQTLLHTTAMVLCCCLGLLLVGLEGAICIIMAMPIMLPIAMMGALVGRSITTESAQPGREAGGMMWCIAALPLLASVEHLVTPEPTFAVRTSIDIQAPPEIVWKQVIAFPEITDEPAWFFRSGIAAPLRARIDGSGVGAIRYCEFTTGTFVEPITVWQENRRLAFDVTEQPEPMFELTPYRHIHPPHLDGAFRSTRGEFLLEALPDGGTRLIGTTWYVLEMHPQSYWTLWSDALVHQIHLRVLNHIRNVAETVPAPE
jgi:uncharacterized membrane protein YhaH (DUF805 family)